MKPGSMGLKHSQIVTILLRCVEFMGLKGAQVVDYFVVMNVH